MFELNLQKTRAT